MLLLPVSPGLLLLLVVVEALELSKLAVQLDVEAGKLPTVPAVLLTVVVAVVIVNSVDALIIVVTLDVVEALELPTVAVEALVIAAVLQSLALVLALARVDPLPQRPQPPITRRT
ncbi:hypothetical protein N7495_009370 [Penicillium taxi]|uniref:uncharacterized protein n=1 Tax=Penicillium taxi TaxID=168475 RepID=UPI002545A1D0|nr:uncharacterized protein N7495_009370 [Penicillium taxi]KAJ5884860.1 hypothetical protein N7495_009370 [Penicillium taxi]